MVLVPKTNVSVRVYVDCRKVNVVSKLDADSMPCIDKLLDWLDMACFYFTLDLKKGMLADPFDCLPA